MPRNRPHRSLASERPVRRRPGNRCSSSMWTPTPFGPASESAQDVFSGPAWADVAAFLLVADLKEELTRQRPRLSPDHPLTVAQFALLIGVLLGVALPNWIGVVPLLIALAGPIGFWLWRLRRCFLDGDAAVLRPGTAKRPTALVASHRGRHDDRLVDPLRLATRFLGFFVVLYLAVAVHMLGSGVQTVTHRYEVTDCGSVVAPARHKLFPFPHEAHEEMMEFGVARQAACAEARALRLSDAMRAAAVGGVLGTGAGLCWRRRRRQVRAEVTEHESGSLVTG